MATDTPKTQTQIEPKPAAPQAAAQPPHNRYDRMRTLIDTRKHELTALLPGTFGSQEARKEAVARFCRQLLTACERSPALLDPDKCQPDSFWLAALNIAALGLDPSGASGEAAIVPFKGRATPMVMVRGYIVLALRSGAAKAIEHQVVCAADQFDYEFGTSPYIRHKPALADRGPPVAVWAIATLPSGERVFEIMGWSAIEAIRARSRAATDGPWVTDPLEMGRKTVVRRIAKRLPWNAADDMIERMLTVQRADDDAFGIIDVTTERPPIQQA
jgi:recombination protein RecT